MKMKEKFFLSGNESRCARTPSGFKDKRARGRKQERMMERKHDEDALKPPTSESAQSVMLSVEQWPVREGNMEGDDVMDTGRQS